MDENATQTLRDDNSPLRPPISDTSLQPVSGYLTSVRLESGPLPSPSVLREYETLEPGITNRLMTIAEKEQEHRHQRDRKILEINGDALTAEIRLALRGQWIGFFVTLLCLLTGLAFVSLGHAIEGTVLSGATIVSLVSLFVYGRKRSSSLDEGEDDEPHDRPR